MNIKLSSDFWMSHQLRKTWLEILYCWSVRPLVRSPQPLLCHQAPALPPSPSCSRTRKGNNWIETITAEALACRIYSLCRTESHYTYLILRHTAEILWFKQTLQMGISSRGAWDYGMTFQIEIQHAAHWSSQGKLWGVWRSHVYQTAQCH